MNIGSQPYIVYAEDSTGEVTHVLECDDANLAEDEATELMKTMPDLVSVGIYRLIKVGKRQASVRWDNPEPKKNGVPRNPEETPGHNKGWRDEEVKYLVQARAAGMSYKGIAKKLGRTPYAVQNKASRMDTCG